MYSSCPIASGSCCQAKISPALSSDWPGAARSLKLLSLPPKPGVYSVQLRFGNRQVAAVSNLRVVAASSNTGGSTRLNRCAGIGFTVLHNDHADKAYLPGGAYTVSSPTMDCGTASAEFTSFLAAAGKPISGWTATSPGAGRATFTQRSSGLSFSVAKAR